MANIDRITILSKGSETWNRWREENRDVVLDLSNAELDDANFFSMNLQNVNFSGSSMKDANFANSDMRSATFALADLANALFLFSNLEGTDMRGANLRNASVEDANLERADLSQANLEGVMMANVDCRNIDLVHVDLTGANLTGANLERAKVSSVVYDSKIFFKTLRKVKFNPVRIWEKRYDLILGTTCRCKGVHTASCYGSQRFRFFLEDQDYFEELLETKRGKLIVFIWWALADCGRSMMHGRVGTYSSFWFLPMFSGRWDRSTSTLQTYRSVV